MPNAQTHQSSQTVGSERLRKAIERNRAKQAKREAKTSKRTQTTAPSSSSHSSQRSLFDREWKSPGASSSASSRTSSQRRGVALSGEEAEFTSEVKRKVDKAPARASYAPAKSTSKGVTRTRRKTARKSTKQSDKDFIHYLVIAAWIFCAFLLGRLIFSTGGVLDYYQSRQLLESKRQEFERIVQENKNLVEEIQMIKNSQSYQKELVREHLGFIDNDEFLILFPKDGKTPSI